MSVGPAMSMPTMKKLACTSKWRSSSDTTPASMPVRPWPPYSTGQCGAAHPASNFVRCHARASSSWAASSSSVLARNDCQPPSPSPRRLATDSSHARASARIAASAGVSSTSMTRTGSSFRGGGTVEPVDLPVMPPVKPMLAKAVHEVPHDAGPALRAEVGRVPLHRVPRRRRDRARLAQRPPAHPLLPRAGRAAAGRAPRALRGRRRDRGGHRGRPRLRRAPAAPPPGRVTRAHARREDAGQLRRLRPARPRRPRPHRRAVLRATAAAREGARRRTATGCTSRR